MSAPTIADVPRTRRERRLLEADPAAAQDHRSDTTPERPLTRRELRELERAAAQESAHAGIPAQLGPATAPVEESAPVAEFAWFPHASVVEPDEQSVTPVVEPDEQPVSPVVDSVDQPAAPAVAMSRRERREQERTMSRRERRAAVSGEAIETALMRPSYETADGDTVLAVSALQLRPRGEARRALRPHRTQRWSAVAGVAGVGAAGVALAAVLVSGNPQPEAITASAGEADRSPLKPSELSLGDAVGDAVSGAGSNSDAVAGGVPDPSERGDAASRSITRTVLPGCDGEAPTSEAKNGELPDEWLCEIGIGKHQLRSDAAVAFAKMNAAYKAETGEDLKITDSYRSLEGQISVKARKPGFAAQPGTSNHGWGLALDFGGGMSSGTGQQYEWLVKNAEEFGWHNPDWAKRNNYELWHWEYFEGQD